MIYYIYTLKDPNTNEIKYIGKTKNLKNRLQRHHQNNYLQHWWTHKNIWLNKLIKNNQKAIIEELDIGDENNINSLEIYWIAQFKQWGFNLTNITEGGDGSNWTNKKHSEETKIKCKMNHPYRKPIIQYDMNMNIINEYVSLRDVERETGIDRRHISKCCRNLKSYKTAGGFYWKFGIKTIEEKSKPSKNQIKQKMKLNQPSRKEVVQYDLRGNILGEFVSLNEATKETGCHIFLISNCCKKKKYYTVNNTTFRYKNDPFDYYEYNKHIQKNSKKVIKYDLNGNFIESYESTKKAAKENNSSSGNISNCCKKKYKTDTHGRKTTKPIVVKGFSYRYDGDCF